MARCTRSMTICFQQLAFCACKSDRQSDPKALNRLAVILWRAIRGSALPGAVCLIPMVVLILLPDECLDLRGWGMDATPIESYARLVVALRDRVCEIGTTFAGVDQLAGL